MTLLNDLNRQPVSRDGADEPRLNARHSAAVLGIALAMRSLVMWTVVTHYPAGWLFTRGMEMGSLAKALLAGKGLSSPFGVATGPTAIVAPVYPILVAAVFRLFGEFSLASAVVIMLAQTAVNLVTIWLMMLVARRLFNQAAATLAGLVWACSLPLVWMPTILWETSISCCLLAGMLALVLKYRAMEEPGPIEWMKVGAYCGLAGLVNPALLPSFLAATMWLAYATRRPQKTRRRLQPLLAALTFALVFAPWPIRNARVFHAFIPTRTTVGFELWMGNRAGATGYLDESLFPTFNRQELADYVSRGEVGYSANKSEIAKQYIFAHPRNFLRMTAVRTFRYWSGTGTRNGSILFAVHSIFTTVFGFVGILLLVRGRRYANALLLSLPMALFPLPYLITHAEFRYRIGIDAVMTVCCAYAVTELGGRVLRSRSNASLASPFREVPLGPAKARAWQSI